MLNREEIEAEVARWTFPGWRFSVREPKLARNKGVLMVLAFETDGTNLRDARAPLQLTNFSMEAPLPAIGVRLWELQQRGLDLVRFVMIHEVGEFLKRDGAPLFDPHDVANEALLMTEVPVMWREGE